MKLDRIRYNNSGNILMAILIAMIMISTCLAHISRVDKSMEGAEETHINMPELIQRHSDLMHNSYIFFRKHGF